jgi:hypothetical protein
VISQGWAVPAAGLPLAGFASYTRDTIRGRTQPNRVSWSVWAAAPLIAFFAELTAHAPPEIALVTLALGLGPLLVLIASAANRGAYWQLTRLDFACGSVSVLALALWSITRRGDVAVLLSIAADALAAAPTARKSWSHPESESPGTYMASGAGAAVTLLAVRPWSLAAAGFPAYIVAVCALITVLITVPRTAETRAAAAFTATIIPLSALAWAGLHIAAILLPPRPAAITPAAVAQPPHAARSVPLTRRERCLASAPPQAPLPPSPQSPAAKPPPPRSRRPTPPPRHSPRPSPTSKRSPSPSSTSPHPSPATSTPTVTPTPTPSQTYPSPTTSASPAPSPTYAAARARTPQGKEASP